MSSTTVVVTGGNSGIGLATAVDLARMGSHVVIGCRNPTRGSAAVAHIAELSGSDKVETHALDLADLRSVERFATALGSLSLIDVLINNAGLVLDRREQTAQGFEKTFGTNHLGHFHLTNLLLPQLRAAPAARIINLASFGHSGSVGGIQWDDIDRLRRYSTWRVYGDSKLANILHAEALTRRLAGTPTIAHSLHPGAVHTGFGRDGDTAGATGALMDLSSLGQRLGLLRTPEVGAATSLYLATTQEAGNSSGLYWSHCTRSRPAPWTRRPGDAETLWQNSEQMIASVS